MKQNNITSVSNIIEVHKKSRWKENMEGGVYAEHLLTVDCLTLLKSQNHRV